MRCEGTNGNPAWGGEKGTNLLLTDLSPLADAVYLRSWFQKDNSTDLHPQGTWNSKGNYVFFIPRKSQGLEKSKLLGALSLRASEPS